jgi:SAM-dependent methyltransferase
MTTTAGRYGEQALDPAWSQERRRLDSLASMADSGTARVIDDLSPEPVRNVLEVGAGSGSVARHLARRFPAATVWATDLDLRHFDTGGLPNIVPLRHDICVDPTPVRSIDLIHCRSVLIFLPDREAVLERLVSWLTPGGWIVLEELGGFPPYDFSTSLGKALLALSTVLQETVGADPQWVLDLMKDPPAPLAARSLRHCGSRFDVHPLHAGSPASEFARLTLEQLRPVLVASGRLTVEEMDHAVDLLGNHDMAEPASSVLSAWGQRPG